MSEEQSYNARYRKGEVTIAQVVYNADRLNYEMIALKERLDKVLGLHEDNDGYCLNCETDWPCFTAMIVQGKDLDD